MEEQTQKKKARRKLRSTQEFNQLNRQSVFAPSTKSESEKKPVAKKNKDLFYLPKIELNIDVPKENFSPNSNRTAKKRSTTAKKKSRSMEPQNMETLQESGKRQTRSMKNREETSTEEEKRDSEIEFKKRRKRKKKNQANSESETASSSDAISETEKYLDKPNIIIIKATPLKANMDVSNGVNEIETRREKRLSMKKSRDHVKSEDELKSLKNGGTIKNSILKSNSKRTRHTSELLALTPLKSDDLSDEVFTSNEHLSETFQLPFSNATEDSSKKRRNTFDLENSTFDISELPVIKEPKSTKKSLNIQGLERKNSPSPSKPRRSKSQDESHVSTRKSVTFMTSERHAKTSNAIKSAIKSDSIRPSSLSTSDRKSVAFNLFESKGRKSKSLCEEDRSKSFPKSPHVSRISTTLPKTKEITPLTVLRRSVAFDAKNNSNSEILLKQSKKSSISSNNFSEHFEKKSVSFCTPPNNRKTSKASFKKSPYVRGSLLKRSRSSSGTPSDQSVPFKEHSKKSSIMPSPIKPLEHLSRSSTKLSNKRKFTPQTHLGRSTALDKKGYNLNGETTFKKLRESYAPSFEISQKKSVSFYTPPNNHKTSKACFKKSPFVRGSPMNESRSSTGSSSELNETFDANSKKSSVLPSPIELIEPSIIDLISPSPLESHLQKTTRTCSYSFRNSSSANDTPAYLTETYYAKGYKSDSDEKGSKRKKWNKSSGVGILDSSGKIHNISPPWLKEIQTDFDSFVEESESSSPEKTVNLASPRKKNSLARQSVYSRLSSQTKYEDLSPIKPDNTVNSSKLESSKSANKLRFAEGPSTSKQNTKSAVKRTKLPNFALIHQKAYEQMENVKEMSERKAARAHQLLSGKKPGQETNMRLPTSNLKVKSPTLKIKSPKTRKILRYSPNKRVSMEKKKNSPSTTSSSFDKKQGKLATSSSIPKVFSKNSKTISKPVEKKILKSHIPKPVVVEKKGLSKLGYKVGQNGNSKLARQEQLKAAASKTQVKRDSLESRRNVVQSVRTNRRFELLMKMRNKK